MGNSIGLDANEVIPLLGDCVYEHLYHFRVLTNEENMHRRSLRWALPELKQHPAESPRAKARGLLRRFVELERQKR